MGEKIKDNKSPKESQEKNIDLASQTLSIIRIQYIMISWILYDVVLIE